MNNSLVKIRFVSLLFVVLAGTAAHAQQQQQQRQNSLREPMAGKRAAARLFRNQNPAKRPNLVRLLDLNPEQVQQIRQINQETRETTRAANIRQRQARRRLDAAIYADEPNQSNVEQQARDLAAAQAATTINRARIELRIRRILTAEQLVRFREVRENKAREPDAQNFNRRNVNQ